MHGVCVCVSAQRGSSAAEVTRAAEADAKRSRHRELAQESPPVDPSSPVFV